MLLTRLFSILGTAIFVTAVAAAAPSSLFDGRTLAGNIAAENERQVVLRTVGQETPVAKSDILSREVSPVSMMPEGLLKTLSNEDVRDLIAYLRTTKQVALEP